MLIVEKLPESPEEFIKIVEEKINAGLLPAVDKRTTSCFYRNKKYPSRACLIGLCVKDEDAKTYLCDNYPIYYYVNILPVILPKWLDLKKARKLQILHDKYFARKYIDKDKFLQKIKEILKIE